MIAPWLLTDGPPHLSALRDKPFHSAVLQPYRHSVLSTRPDTSSIVDGVTCPFSQGTAVLLPLLSAARCWSFPARVWSGVQGPQVGAGPQGARGGCAGTSASRAAPLSVASLPGGRVPDARLWLLGRVSPPVPAQRCQGPACHMAHLPVFGFSRSCPGRL